MYSSVTEDGRFKRASIPIIGLVPLLEQLEQWDCCVVFGKLWPALDLRYGRHVLQGIVFVCHFSRTVIYKGQHEFNATVLLCL